MSEIETELVKATKVKKASFKVRQDYLAALVRAVDKLDQDKWDNLSDEAVSWHTAAVAQMDKKKPIEDFDNQDMKKATQAIVEDFDNAEGEIPEVSEDDNSPLEEHESANTDSSASKDDDSAEDPEAEEPLPQQEVEEKKPVKKPKTKKIKEVSPNIKPGDVERYEKITGEKDRFGITIGTKTHDAVKMYNTPEGATLKQTGDKLGGRHYNILAKLAKDGHKVEKLPGGVWRVTHKDD